MKETKAHDLSEHRLQTQVARPADIWAQAQCREDQNQEKSTITGLKFSFWSDDITFFCPQWQSRLGKLSECPLDV